MKQHHNRFKTAPWYPKEDQIVLIGGAGGIGSWTSLLISRAGFKPVIYDFDLLEEHNLGGQLYSRKHLNTSKVVALQTIIKDFADEDVMVFNEKVTEGTPTNPFVIAAFDNMASRKIMFNSWFELMRDNPELREQGIFIDGRLNAEQMQIICVTAETSKNCERYINEFLFEDSDVPDEPCTFQQTSHAAAMIASHIVGFFTNHIVNVIEKSKLRAIPFYWEYFIPMDLLETK